MIDQHASEFSLYYNICEFAFFGAIVFLRSYYHIGNLGHALCEAGCHIELFLRHKNES